MSSEATPVQLNIGKLAVQRASNYFVTVELVLVGPVRALEAIVIMKIIETIDGVGWADVAFWRSGDVPSNLRSRPSLAFSPREVKTCLFTSFVVEYIYTDFVFSCDLRSCHLLEVEA